MKHRRFLFALLAIALMPHARASSFLWAISGDPNNGFVPNQLSSVVTSPSTVTTVATLGDGSLAFNGGLTVGPGGVLYGIANDSFGAGSLYTIQPNGTIALVGSAGGLGTGFLGGLTFSAGIFYAAVTDFLGNTTLDSIATSGVSTPLGKSLGTGFTGLAYDSTNGLFYGISNDPSSASTLVSFTLAGNAVTNVGALGFGFGGLTYDAALDLFWAIGPVNKTSSQLFQITTPGSVSAPVMTLGDGFAELAVQPAAVPEPETGLLVAACLAVVFWISRRIRWAPGIYSNTRR